jgi:hypothetical protein
VAASGGDIIRITDIQSFLGQTLLNVYFYQLNLEGVFLTGYLADIALHFTEAVVTPVSGVQDVTLSHTSLFLENLSNGVDILTYTTDFPIDGTIPGADVFPPYVSLGFQLIREERTTRNGYKRIGGISESSVTAGVIDLPSSLIEDVQNGMKADIVSGLATLCNPVIVRHPITIPLVSPVFSHVGDCLFKSVGTQNTRKFNRGI